MSGVSSAIRVEIMASYIPITFNEKKYRISWHRTDFERGADPELLKFTERVLACFRKIEKTVNSKRDLTLDSDFGQQQLEELAKYGKLAYRRFFKDDDARQVLHYFLQNMGDNIPAPTFISDLVPFPWEVLFHGNDYHQPNVEEFWGLQYTPARILTPKIDVFDHALEQILPSDMLFCLHHKLRQAHQNEWPEIRKLIQLTNKGRCRILSPVDEFTSIKTGEKLLEYLNHSTHNMLHFACHCRQSSSEIDALELSILQEDLNEEISKNTQVIELGVFTFELIDGQFNLQPFIFLNACQSAGGTDELRKTFNLPQMFIERGAGAVIATACPVPDLFAAAFAKQFYTFFLDEQMSIGQALRETRLYFLTKHNNPLGLAYGLYSPPYYRLDQALMMKGAA